MCSTVDNSLDVLKKVGKLYNPIAGTPDLIPIGIIIIFRVIALSLLNRYKSMGRLYMSSQVQLKHFKIFLEMLVFLKMKPNISASEVVI